MKKLFFFLAALVLGAMAASVNAQTLSSSTVDVRYCFTTLGEETVVENCAPSYLWVDESGRKEDTTITATGTHDYVRTLINARGCDSIATLHLTLNDFRTFEDIDTAICEGDKFVKDGHTYTAAGDYTYTLTNDRGCEHTVNVRLQEMKCGPEGISSSKAIFSISKTQKVYISQGNLVYSTDGTHGVKGGGTKTGTFSFAAQSYLLGSKFTNGSSGVSTSYNPNGTSSGYGSSVSGTDYDWGVYNAISNGGNTPSTWRTLTDTEWAYIINSRTNASTKKGVATIKKGGDLANDMAVYVLLPDNFEFPEYNGTPLTLNNAFKYNSNAYTIAQWELMRKAGAICLPICSPANQGTSCSYWTSTAKLLYMSNNSGTITCSPSYSSSNVAGVKTLSQIRLAQDIVP